MESELNEALENTVKNFEESGERLPPREILFRGYRKIDYG